MDTGKVLPEARAHRIHKESPAYARKIVELQLLAGNQVHTRDLPTYRIFIPISALELTGHGKAAVPVALLGFSALPAESGRV